jgi:cell division protease FtsH
MVTQWGMSAAMGPRTFGKRQSMVFLGRDISEERDYSEKTAEEIDTEVKRLIAEAHERCKQILRDKREVLDRLAEHLIEVETIEGEDLIAILDPAGEYRSSRVDNVTPTGPSTTMSRKSKEDQDKKPNQGKPGLVWGS